MRKLALILILITLSLSFNAQTWKIQIETTTTHGNYITRKLVMRPDHKITIGKTIEPFGYPDVKPYSYRGTFLGGTPDSLKIRLNYPSPRLPVENSGRVITFALSDISYINYSVLPVKTGEFLNGTVFIGILGSLAVLLASPLICIDYNDWKFNSNRYKNWALGSTIGLGSSLTILVAAITIDQKKIQFKPGWLNKNAKVWNFKKK